MSEAKEMYYMFKIADEMWKNHRPPIIHYSAVDYVHELEQQNKQLKESQTQKRIIKLCERLDNAERQNGELMEFLKKTMLYMKTQRPFMNYSQNVELYESILKFLALAEETTK